MTILLICRGVGGPDKKVYELTIEFHAEINPAVRIVCGPNFQTLFTSGSASKLQIYFFQESKYAVLPRNIPMMLKKKDEGPYWPRLLKVKQKVSFQT